MATSGGPNVNRDGLVLFLDTPTNRSFRGEPTVNVINGGVNRATVVALPISTGTHAGISRTVTLTSYSSDRPNVLRYTSTNDTGYAMLNQQFSIQNQSGTTYTYSFEYKQLSGPSNSLVFSVVYPNGYKTPAGEAAASNISNTQIDLEDGWKRWILTYTCNNTGYNYVRFNLFTGGHRGTQDGDFDFYFDNFMLQEGSKRTPFVGGTRGTTVATGGGWRDMSGNNNHGEIVNGVTTDSDGTLQHSLDFDGTDDKVELPISLASLGSVGSIEVVFKSDTNHRGALLGWGNLDTTHWGTFEIGPATSGFTDEYIGYVNLTGGTSSDLVMWGRDSSAGSYKLSDGNYHHVVVVIDGVDNCFYVDGEKITPSFSQGSGTVSAFIDVDSIQKIRVGDSTYSGGHIPFNGKIPLIRMYDRGLTQQEVLENYKAIKSRYGL